jgi:hypothetical protein
MGTRVKPAYDAGCVETPYAKAVPERRAAHNVVAGLDLTGLDPVTIHPS